MKITEQKPEKSSRGIKHTNLNGQNPLQEISHHKPKKLTIRSSGYSILDVITSSVLTTGTSLQSESQYIACISTQIWMSYVRAENLFGDDNGLNGLSPVAARSARVSVALLALISIMKSQGRGMELAASEGDRWRFGLAKGRKTTSVEPRNTNRNTRKMLLKCSKNSNVLYAFDLDGLLSTGKQLDMMLHDDHSFKCDWIQSNCPIFVVRCVGDSGDEQMPSICGWYSHNDSIKTIKA